MILQPQQDPLFETRLIWMWDNQPELLLELYKKGTLRQHVIDKVKQANKSYFGLIDRGVDEWTAKEIRLSILAPAEGMEEEKEQPISEEAFEKILLEMTQTEDYEDEE